MPNWTYNTITVTGSKEGLERMMSEAQRVNGVLNLSSWFPVPETFKKYDTTNHPDGKGLNVGEEWWDGLGAHEGKVTEELIEEFKQATKEQMEKYGVVGWYDYNRKMYGCKWDCKLTVDGQTDNQIDISVDTPWSEPDAWLGRMSVKYPELTFHNHAEYEEGFWYDTTYEAGEEYADGSGTLDWDDEKEGEEV